MTLSEIICNSNVRLSKSLGTQWEFWGVYGHHIVIVLVCVNASISEMNFQKVARLKDRLSASAFELKTNKKFSGLAVAVGYAT